MVVTLLAWVLLLAPSPPEDTCQRLRAGYEALVAGSFSVERHLVVSRNGEPKLREVAWLSWTGGTLRTDRVHAEVLDKKLDTIDPRSDPAVEQRFSCSRVVAIGDKRFVLRSEKGDGELELEWDEEREILFPVSWRSTEKKRRAELETRASYATFDWRD